VLRQDLELIGGQDEAQAFYGGADHQDYQGGLKNNGYMCTTIKVSSRNLCSHGCMMKIES